MYDHTKQYRCTIIRGKSKNEMDDLLLTYAQIIIEATPCSKSDFQKIFNDELATHLNYPEKKKKGSPSERGDFLICFRVFIPLLS